ncbi:DUF4974 domain-containing protein [Sinomicrobium pectinilyticum]|uniref:DUF4974 domain-containing protein n=1 Tax=Sinomicrobium pectinilyticum TaxID=1084421 RepID=A0A3N0EJC3_SINP1|nr:FecR domain-containing protein [Sinomicrobium pectinilyticum]RNL87874.1 DUF4974 domain-containing protein [Sinomicrobium pectinilyticum]
MEEKKYPYTSETDLHKHIDEVWKASENAKVDESGLGNRVWKRISLSISAQKWRMYRLTTAAVVVIMLSAGLSWYTFSGKEEVLIVNNENKPKHIKLEDGSEIILNRFSTLSYHPSERRKVKLLGEAFFDITKDSLHPFRVETDSLAVMVLGTSFNVYAYRENPDVRVSLYSGKVTIGMANGSQKQLSPGREFVYDFTDAGGYIREFHKKGTIAWTSSSIECSDTPLSELFVKIENYYHIKLLYDADSIQQCRITGTFKIEDDISQLFRLIRFSHNIDFEKKGTDRYQLVSGSCE